MQRNDIFSSVRIVINKTVPAARSLPVHRSTITHIGVSATSQGGGQVTADARVDLRALGRVLVRAKVADAVRGTRVHLEVLGG